MFFHRVLFMWFVAIALQLGGLWSGPSVSSGPSPATVEPYRDGLKKITLIASAARRLGIETDQVRDVYKKIGK